MLALVSAAAAAGGGGSWAWAAPAWWTLVAVVAATMAVRFAQGWRPFRLAGPVGGGGGDGDLQRVGGWCEAHRTAAARRADRPPPCGRAFASSARAALATALPRDYDPEDTESTRRFAPAKAGTQCVFAKRSRVWGSPPWVPGAGVEGNARLAAPALALFVSLLRETRPRIGREAVERMLGGETVARRDWAPASGGALARVPPLDAFLFEVRGAEHGRTVEAFARTVNAVLRALSACDPGAGAWGDDACAADCFSLGHYYRRGAGQGARAEEEEEEEEARPRLRRLRAMDVPPSAFDSPRWHYTFMGEPFFVTTFAPCYPASHPRHMFPRAGLNEDSCFVMLQPEAGFLQHNISPDTPHTRWDSPRTERDRIRVAFRDAGRPFVVPPSVSYPTAHFIVPPVPADSGEVVRWWLCS